MDAVRLYEILFIDGWCPPKTAFCPGANYKRPSVLWSPYWMITSLLEPENLATCPVNAKLQLFLWLPPFYGQNISTAHNYY